MKAVNNISVVLNVEDQDIVIMAKDKFSVWDPAGEYWGIAQGFRVVRDLPSKTLVLVPIGGPHLITQSAATEEMG